MDHSLNYYFCEAISTFKKASVRTKKIVDIPETQLHVT